MLLQKFQAYCKQYLPNLSPGKTKFLLAVSGGVDSIALTDVVFKAGYDFKIAHCNFRLRGDESERDEAFVKLLGEKYNTEVLVKKFDTREFAATMKISIQEAARKLRYNWFHEVVDSCFEKGISKFIVTAHHANDNLETLLINFFRGTGISGLHGIMPKQDSVIRPLLFADKGEIIEYAKENELKWLEDSSNASEKYTRNLFRLQVLPLIKQVFPQVERNLLQNIERFREAEILYSQAIELHKKKLIEQKGNELHIPILKLQKSSPVNSIIWEIIKDFNFHAAQIDEVKKLFAADNGSFVASASHRIIKNRNWLLIASLEPEQAQHFSISRAQEKLVFADGILHFEHSQNKDFKFSNDEGIAFLDEKEIRYPLLLRKWKQGDYFYPLGMRKKKKVGKFFIDQKLSKTEKENVWVLETNKKILWIVGYRIDDRFKITKNTTGILKISLTKTQEEAP